MSNFNESILRNKYHNIYNNKFGKVDEHIELTRAVLAFLRIEENREELAKLNALGVPPCVYFIVKTNKENEQLFRRDLIRDTNYKTNKRYLGALFGCYFYFEGYKKEHTKRRNLFVHNASIFKKV